MEIKDLKDPRDKAACEAAQKRPRVPGATSTDVVWRKPDEKIYGFDEDREQEFQTSVRTDAQGIPVRNPARYYGPK